MTRRTAEWKVALIRIRASQVSSRPSVAHDQIEGDDRRDRRQHALDRNQTVMSLFVSIRTLIGSARAVGRRRAEGERRSVAQVATKALLANACRVSGLLS